MDNNLNINRLEKFQKEFQVINMINKWVLFISAISVFLSIFLNYPLFAYLSTFVFSISLMSLVLEKFIVKFAKFIFEEVFDILGKVIDSKQIIHAVDGETNSAAHILAVHPLKENIDLDIEDSFTHSFSILRYSAIQDLLCSKKYINHFFNLSNVYGNTEKNNFRILILNDQIRNAKPLEGFLALSKNVKIKTYPWAKSDFYTLISELNGYISSNRIGDFLPLLFLKGEGEVSFNLSNDKVSDWRIRLENSDSDLGLISSYSKSPDSFISEEEQIAFVEFIYNIVFSGKDSLSNMTSRELGEVCEETESMDQLMANINAAYTREKSAWKKFVDVQQWIKATS